VSGKESGMVAVPHVRADELEVSTRDGSAVDRLCQESQHKERENVKKEAVHADLCNRRRLGKGTRGLGKARPTTKANCQPGLCR
jgi:hypothetical protein